MVALAQVDHVHEKTIVQILARETTEGTISKCMAAYKAGRIIAHLVDKGAKTIIILPVLKFPTDNDTVTIRKIEMNRTLEEIEKTTKDYDCEWRFLKEYAEGTLWHKQDIIYQGKYINRHYAPNIMDIEKEITISSQFRENDQLN